MSYCRWSSDNFNCDLYVYASVGDFFAIHVAGSRPDGNGLLAPIGLPHDGESFQCGDEEATIAKMLELRAIGYRFPDYALDRLREEMAESTPTTNERAEER